MRLSYLIREGRSGLIRLRRLDAVGVWRASRCRGGGRDRRRLPRSLRACPLGSRALITWLAVVRVAAALQKRDELTADQARSRHRQRCSVSFESQRDGRDHRSALYLQPVLRGLRLRAKGASSNSKKRQATSRLTQPGPTKPAPNTC
jgi:hypothetical protein